MTGSTRRTRVVRLSLAVLAFLALPKVALGQGILGGPFVPGGPAAPPPIGGATMAEMFPQNPEMARQIQQTAPQYIKAAERRDRDWVTVAQILQPVLDLRTDFLLKKEVKDPAGKVSIQYTSGRAEAERLLASLPPLGLAAYRVKYGGAAKSCWPRPAPTRPCWRKWCAATTSPTPGPRPSPSWASPSWTTAAPMRRPTISAAFCNGPTRPACRRCRCSRRRWPSTPSATRPAKPRRCSCSTAACPPPASPSAASSSTPATSRRKSPAGPSPPPSPRRTGRCSAATPAAPAAPTANSPCWRSAIGSCCRPTPKSPRRSPRRPAASPPPDPCCPASSLSPSPARSSTAGRTVSTPSTPKPARNSGATSRRRAARPCAWPRCSRTTTSASSC